MVKKKKQCNVLEDDRVEQWLKDDAYILECIKNRKDLGDRKNLNFRFIKEDEIGIPDLRNLLTDYDRYVYTEVLGA